MAAKICSKCGFEREDADLFCVNCGQNFDEGVVTGTSPPQKSRRIPKGLGSLVIVLLLGISAITWTVASGRIPNPIKQAGATKNTASRINDKPFLVLIAPGKGALDVLLTDVDGNLIREAGAVTSTNEVRWQFWDDSYNRVVSTSRTGVGAGAWAWPDEQVALIALGTLEGIDLLRVDMYNDQLIELARSAANLTVQGFTGRDVFAWSITQKNGDRTLFTASTTGEQAIQYIEDPQLSGMLLSSDGHHLYFQTKTGFVASTDGAYVHQLDTSNKGRGVFSRDGQTLFYSTGHQIVRAKADGSDGRIITEIGRKDLIYPVSVGDKYLVAFQQIENRTSLKVMTWEGKVTTQIKCPTDANCTAFQLPGNRELSILTIFGNGSIETELANSDGSERMMQAKGREPLPMLLADQRHMVMNNLGDNGLEILLYDVVKKKNQIIDKGVSRFNYLASNEHYLIYGVLIDENWALMAVNLKNGDVWELDSGAPAGYPIAYFLLNGKSIVYEARSGMLTQDVVDNDGHYFGSVYYPDADIYQVGLDNPDPKRIYPEAGLLAASLVR